MSMRPPHVKSMRASLQLRKDLDQARSQGRRQVLRIAIGIVAASAKQHAAVRRKPEVVEHDVAVGDRQILRIDGPRGGLVERFGRDDVAAGRERQPAQRPALESMVRAACENRSTCALTRPRAVRTQGLRPACDLDDVAILEDADAEPRGRAGFAHDEVRADADGRCAGRCSRRDRRVVPSTRGMSAGFDDLQCRRRRLRRVCARRRRADACIWRGAGGRFHPAVLQIAIDAVACATRSAMMSWPR